MECDGWPKIAAITHCVTATSPTRAFSAILAVLGLPIIGNLGVINSGFKSDSLREHLSPKHSSTFCHVTEFHVFSFFESCTDEQSAPKPACPSPHVNRGDCGRC
jgi:hypothetical protein